MTNRIQYRQTVVRHGVSMGAALAMILSYSLNKSILLAIASGILSWIYVVYFVIVHRLL